MHLFVGGDDTDDVGCLGQAADVESVVVTVVGDLAAPPCFERFRKRKGISYYELVLREVGEPIRRSGVQEPAGVLS